MVYQWEELNKEQVLDALWPDGFAQLGITDHTYAAGLSSMCTLLGWSVDGKIKLVFFLLWKIYPEVCEMRFWFQPGLGNKLLLEGLASAKGELKNLGVKFAFFYCRKSPHKNTGKKVGAIIRKLPIGTMYEWEMK